MKLVHFEGNHTEPVLINPEYVLAVEVADLADFRRCKLIMGDGSGRAYYVRGSLDYVSNELEAAK